MSALQSTPGNGDIITNDTELARFKQRFAIRVMRRQLGIDLEQDEALAVLADEHKTQLYYRAWLDRTRRQRASGPADDEPSAAEAPPANNEAAPASPQSPKPAPSGAASTGCLAILCFLVGLGLILWGVPAAEGHVKSVAYDCTPTTLGGVRCLHNDTTWIADGYSITMICVAILGFLIIVFGLIAALQGRAASRR